MQRRSTRLGVLGTGSLVISLVLVLTGCPEPEPTASTDDTGDVDTDTDTALVDGRWDQATWATLQGMAASELVPVPAPSNAVADDPGAAALGQMFYFEKAHAGPITAAGADDGTNGGLGEACDMGKVACESCHQAATLALTDERSNPPDHATTIGTGPVGRNPPGAANSVFYEYIGLSGARDSLWSVSAFATNAAPLGSSELTTAHMINGKYADLYNDTFDPDLPADLDTYPSWGSPGDGGAFDGMTDAQKLTVSTIFANYAKALGAYQRQLVLGGTDFDRYVGGDMDALSDEEKAGLELFIGEANCIACHSGPHFSDQGFHNIATSANEDDTGRFSAIGALNTFPFTSAGAFSDDTSNNKIDTYPDATKDGEGKLVAADAFKGQFRTAALRGSGGSAPYMHKGDLATLLDVMAHYQSPPAPAVGTLDPAMGQITITAEDHAPLAAFVEALSGEEVAASLLIDTSRSNAEAQAAGLTGYEPSAANLPDGHACKPTR